MQVLLYSSKQRDFFTRITEKPYGVRCVRLTQKLKKHGDVNKVAERESES